MSVMSRFFTPGISLTATIAGQTYNLNDGREIRLELYDLGLAPARRLWQRAPGQRGRTNLGAVGEPRFIDLAWRLTGHDLRRFFLLRETIQTVFRQRQNEPVQLTFTFPGGVVRSADVYLDGELLFADRRHTMTRVSGTFVADDPRLYDPALRTVVFALLPTSGGLPIPFTVPIPIGGSVLNVIQEINYASGSRLAAEEYPVIIVNGPIENPIIENLTTNERIDLAGLVLGIGQSVTIDLGGQPRRDSKTIRREEGSTAAQFLSTDSDLATWHLAYAGERLFDGTYSSGTNLVRILGDNVTLLSSAELRYYDRYEAI
jgi:hypothetical protein